MNGFLRELQGCLHRPLGTRFTIRDLMLWTAIVALLIGLYRLEAWLGREKAWIPPAIAFAFSTIMVTRRALRRRK
jgi:hypothetical protein